MIDIGWQRHIPLLLGAVQDYQQTRIAVGVGVSAICVAIYVAMSWPLRPAGADGVK